MSRAKGGPEAGDQPDEVVAGEVVEAAAPNPDTVKGHSNSDSHARERAGCDHSLQTSVHGCVAAEHPREDGHRRVKDGGETNTHSASELHQRSAHQARLAWLVDVARNETLGRQAERLRDIREEPKHLERHLMAGGGKEAHGRRDGGDAGEGSAGEHGATHQRVCHLPEGRKTAESGQAVPAQWHGAPQLSLSPAVPEEKGSGDNLSESGRDSSASYAHTEVVDQYEVHDKVNYAARREHLQRRPAVLLTQAGSLCYVGHHDGRRRKCANVKI
mmetsp:Transcript_4048/g.7422  ORF Transcript_4048/g.7422 Transcript_4048/m.7422 type:complete len:273 (+) Transcript_4048:453-1271(+)